MLLFILLSCYIVKGFLLAEFHQNYYLMIRTVLIWQDYSYYTGKILGNSVLLAFCKHKTSNQTPLDKTNIL